jgi:hypothetical protein
MHFDDHQCAECYFADHESRFDDLQFALSFTNDRQIENWLP